MKKYAFVVILATLSISLFAQSMREFSWHGFSISYPSDYKITDKDFDELYEFCCEIDNPDISFINFSFLSNDLFSLLDYEDAEDTCVKAVNDCKLSLLQYLKNATFSKPVIKKTNGGAIVVSNFSGKMLTTAVQGKIFTMVKGSYLVIALAQAETQAYLNELDQILASIRVGN